MKCFEKVTAKTFIGLLSGSAYGEWKDGILVAVETWYTKAVWIHTAIGWVKISNVPADCQTLCMCICEVREGFLVLGGQDNKGKTSSQCWLFSFPSSQWRKVQDMNLPKDSVSAVVVGDVLLAIGGKDSKGDELDVCEKLNLVTGAWSSAKPMPRRMSQPRVAAAAGHVYIKDFGSRVFISYDPNTDTHTNIPVLSCEPKDIYGACMVSYNDKLYLMGGEKSLAVMYDPHTQNWEQLASPSAKYYARYGCCAVQMCGKIVLCGGSTHEESDHNIIEEYDVEHDAWKLLDIRLPFNFDYDHCHVFKQSQ